jgi:hypothetical protein
VLGKIILAGLAIALLSSGPMRLLRSHERSNVSIAWAQTQKDGNSESSLDAAKDGASESDAESSPPDVMATWIGRSIDRRYGQTGIDLQISQRGHQLKGFWVFLLGEGRFTGQITGDALSLHMKRKGNEGRGCNLILNATLVSDTEMTGTYSIGRCNPADAGLGAGGTVDFTKE